MAPAVDAGRRWLVDLLFGVGDQAGRILAGHSGGEHVVQSLRAPAAGLPEVRFQTLGAGGLAAPAAPAEAAISGRVRGALTDPVWERFRQLRYALVGAGRSGSVMGHSLGRLGLGEITVSLNLYQV